MIENGFYVVFEGIDGSGKTAISKRVAEIGLEKERNWVWTCEPKRKGLSLEYKDKLPHEAAYAFALDRYDQMNDVASRLSAGLTVISDRSYISTLAYQGAAGMPIQWGMQIQPPNLILPWLVVYLQCDAELAASRATPREEPERLAGIAAMYESALYMPRQLSVVRINTGLLSIEDAAHFVYQAILNHREHAFFAAWKEHRHG